MNRYKSGENRNQINVLPMCLDDMIAPDNEVRAIDAIVDRMDIQSMGFIYSETKETGRKAYSPVDMFKLYSFKKFSMICDKLGLIGKEICQDDVE